MKLTPLAKQLKYFESHRQLKDTGKKPLTNPEDIHNWVEESFQRTRDEDDGPEDYDPIPGRVFKTNSKNGKTVGATFELEGERQRLERSEIHYRERRLLRVHKTPIAIEAFWSWSHPDYPQLLECFRVDLKNPEGHFYQRLELAPEPWV